MLWFWTFFAVDNFDFTRKIVKKKFGWKTCENVWVLSKLNFWTKIVWVGDKSIWVIYNFTIIWDLFLAANLETPGTILNSLSDSGVSFIDSLIEKEQKIAISQYVVQQYLQEIWKGHVQLKAWQFLLLFTTFLLVPPLWFIFSIPVDKGLNKVPVIKVNTCMCIYLQDIYILYLLSVHVLLDFALVFHGFSDSNMRGSARQVDR